MACGGGETASRLSIVSWNVNSVMKDEKFKGFMLDYIEEFDIICLQETKANEETIKKLRKELNKRDGNPKYRCYCECEHTVGIDSSTDGRQHSRPYRGVAVFINIQRVSVQNLRKIPTGLKHVVRVSLDLSDKKGLILLCTYVGPGEQWNDNFGQLEECVARTKEQYNRNMLIVGDLNIHTSNKKSKNARRLAKLCEDHKLKILNNTEISTYSYDEGEGTMIDYMLISSDLHPWVTGFNIAPDNDVYTEEVPVTRHHPLLCDIMQPGLSIISCHMDRLFCRSVIKWIQNGYYDIICLQSTYLLSAHDIKLLLIYNNQYSYEFSIHVVVFMKKKTINTITEICAQKKKKNQVFVYLSKEDNNLDDDMLLICVHLKRESYLKSGHFDEMLQDLKDVFEANVEARIVLLGNFGVCCGGIVENKTPGNSRAVALVQNREWKRCMDLCIDYKLKVLNGPSINPERPGICTNLEGVTATLSDYMFVSASLSSQVSWFGVANRTYQENNHRPLVCSLNRLSRVPCLGLEDNMAALRL